MPMRLGLDILDIPFESASTGISTYNETGAHKSSAVCSLKVKLNKLYNFDLAQMSFF